MWIKLMGCVYRALVWPHSSIQPHSYSTTTCCTFSISHNGGKVVRDNLEFSIFHSFHLIDLLLCPFYQTLFYCFILLILPLNLFFRWIRLLYLTHLYINVLTFVIALYAFSVSTSVTHLVNVFMKSAVYIKWSGTQNE